MREIHASVIASVDGFHEDLERSYAFVAPFASPESPRQSLELLRRYDTLLFGRTTYELGRRSWTSESARRHRDPALVTTMNSAEKIVFSATLQSADWGPTQLFKGDLVEVMESVKSGPGGGLLVVGSASIRTALLRARLLDRLLVSYVPIVLGAGHSLFGGLRERVAAQTRRVAVSAGGTVDVEYRLPTRRVAGLPR